MSVTSASGSVPEGTDHVKALLMEAVGDADVLVHRCGLSVRSALSVDCALDLVVRLVDGAGAAESAFRLCTGDVWRSMAARSAERRRFAQGLRARLGENYYDQVRRYGWVAGMWSQEKRGEGKNWAYYLRGPDGAGKKHERREIKYSYTRHEVVGGSELFECQRTDGTKYWVRLEAIGAQPE